MSSRDNFRHTRIDNVIAGFEVHGASWLGEGGFGTVCQARQIDKGDFVAAKCIKTRVRANRQQALREIENMKKASHENLVRYLNHSIGQRAIWIFVELCDLGDLEDYFIRTNPNRQEYVQLMKQMATAIEYLHGIGMVHRDIKPGNILIKSSALGGVPIVKICDLGLTRKIDLSKFRRLLFTTLNIGTTAFMAPELLGRHRVLEVKCNESVDIFALGITFLCMICYRNRKGERLIPAEDYGYSMNMLKREGNLESGSSYLEEIVPVTGDDVERKIRELIQRMIPYEMDSRVEAPVVLSSINDIILFLETNPAEPEADNSGTVPTKTKVVTGEFRLDTWGLMNLFNEPSQGQFESEFSETMNYLTILNTDWYIGTVCSDSQKLTRAARVEYSSWNDANLAVKVWDLSEENEQDWKSRPLLFDHHLGRAPEWALPIVLLDNKLYLRAKLDRSPHSKVIAIDLHDDNADVFRMSHDYPAQGDPVYCCYKKQILLPDRESSTIVQLDVELNELNKWTDLRMREFLRVCSNETRVAVGNKFKSISVFKWEHEKISNDMIYSVEFENFEGMVLQPDNSLMAINWNYQWSVWDKNGKPLHENVQHPTLVPGMRIDYSITQDPNSHEWFVEEWGKLPDAGTLNSGTPRESFYRVIYSSRIVMSRLKSGDTSQIDPSRLKAEKTVKPRIY